MSSQQMLIDVSPSTSPRASYSDTIMSANGTAVAPARTTKPATTPTVKNRSDSKDNKIKTEASAEQNDNIKSVRHHEVEARQAYRLADAVYNNASEVELAEFGTADERCQLLGLFTYQLMEIANINRVVRHNCKSQT